MSKKRQPLELLGRLHHHAMSEYNTPGLNDWHWAALDVAQDATDAIEKLPPKRPKRPSYYGQKGGLRNPFRP